MRKQFANFVEFSVYEMHHISQQLKEWLRNLRKQVQLWTVNYPWVIVQAGLSTTLSQWVKVLLRAQEHRFAIVPNNWTFREAPCNEFSRTNCVCMLTRYNWRKNSSQQTMCIAENLLNGCRKTKKWTAIFRRKSYLAMRRTFNLMGKWTHKNLDLGRGESSSDSWKAIARTTSHCLVRSLGWRCDWAVRFRKRGRKCSNSEWLTLLQPDKEIFMTSIGRYRYGRHVVPAGRRNLSHCARNYWVVARKFSWPCHLTQKRSELATEVVRFDTVPLLFWGFMKSRIYANKPQTIPEFKVEIRSVIGKIEPQLCGKVIESFVKRTRVCQQSWGKFFGYCVPQLIAVCVLYTEIKISVLSE